MIRHFVFILPVLLFFTASVSGQNTFNAGFVAGINAAQIDGDGMVGYDKFGFNVGLVGKVWLSQRWGISLELLYSEKGARDRGSDLVMASPERYYMAYADVPVGVVFREGSFVAKAGVTYGRLVRSQYTDINGFESELNLNSNAGSAYLGLGWFFTNRFGVEARAANSIANIMKDKSFAPMFHRYLSFRAFYIL